MVKKISSLALIIFLAIDFAAAQQNIIVVNAAEAKYVINKNIYGHFAEHLGHCIYDGFYVGDTNKIIPNTEGVRNDIIEALKKTESSQSPLARWLFC
ncbi:MAG: hypothetical protein WDO16_12895 [Bacteroidota bacterium]